MTITLIILASVLWSVVVFLVGLSFGRDDDYDIHECFRSKPDPACDLLCQERLRTDYSPSIDRFVTKHVVDFIKLRNKKVAENIGKDPPDHGHHL